MVIFKRKLVYFVQMIQDMKRWTEEEISQLKVLYPEMESGQLSRILNRSPKAIRNKASRLELKAIKRSHSFPASIEEYPPSPELSYLIGALLGDGSICHYVSYRISLAATDIPFVRAVQVAFHKIVGRKPKIYKLKQHELTISPRKTIYRTGMSDKSLYHLLSKPFEALKPYIEKHSTEFLRGFFDAEGSAWIKKTGEPVIKYCNNNIELIDYVRRLLEKNEIYPSPGTYKSTGNLSKTGDPCYFIHICKKDSVERFMRLISSSIPRKRLMV